jgi:hypothetical protein
MRAGGAAAHAPAEEYAEVGRERGGRACVYGDAVRGAARNLAAGGVRARAMNAPERSPSLRSRRSASCSMRATQSHHHTPRPPSLRRTLVACISAAAALMCQWTRVCRTVPVAHRLKVPDLGVELPHLGPRTVQLLFERGGLACLEPQLASVRQPQVPQVLLQLRHRARQLFPLLAHRFDLQLRLLRLRCSMVPVPCSRCSVLTLRLSLVQLLPQAVVLRLQAVVLCLQAVVLLQDLCAVRLHQLCLCKLLCTRAHAPV